MNFHASSDTTRSSRHRLFTPLLTALVAVSAASSAQAFDQHSSHKLDRDKGGVVYAMSNNEDKNEIFVYHRNRLGELTAIPHATVATGGEGGSDNAPVDPLGSQNSLVYSEELEMLFAVNAGDNTVTAFKTGYRGIKLHASALVDSAGYIPVSLAVNDNRLYVLNAGGTGSVATFSIDDNGGLSLLGVLDLGLSNSTEIPFTHVMAPGQVGIDELGRRVIITHAGGQQLLTAALNDNGVPQGNLTATPTLGVVPFSFAVTEFGNVLVAEAGSGSVSSFGPSAVGTPLIEQSAAVPTGQAATCWIVSTDAGFAYTANTGSDNISLYSHSRTGTLELISTVAINTADAPTDMTLAGNGGYLYTLDANSGTISGFAIDSTNGSLTTIDTEFGLPQASGIQGIAANDL